MGTRIEGGDAKGEWELLRRAWRSADPAGRGGDKDGEESFGKLISLQRGPRHATSRGMLRCKAGSECGAR